METTQKSKTPTKDEVLRPGPSKAPETWERKTLEVIGHTIIWREVIGIGPVLMQDIGGEAEQQCYGSYQLSFEVHCLSRSIPIKSNVLYRRGLEVSTLAHYKYQHKAFFDTHQEVRQKIITDDGK